MQQRGRYFDDFTKLLNGAMGLARGARQEVQTIVIGILDRLLAERYLVTREEFEVLREMTIAMRDENRIILEKLEEVQSSAKPKTRSSKRKTTKTASNS